MVPGEGPLPALGFVLGEAPGRDEVAQLRPFVGRSGKLLDEALKIVGLPREELYITNVVKEIPLDEQNRIRRPSPAEIEKWSELLAEELEACAPAAILTLGNTASNVFGQQLQDDVFRVWHPAYVLRSPSRFTTWVNSIRPFAEHLDAHR